MIDETFKFTGRRITDGRSAQFFIERGDGSKLSVVLPFEDASRLRYSLAEQLRAGVGKHDHAIELEAEAAVALRYLRALADDASGPPGAAEVASSLAVALRAAAQTGKGLAATMSCSSEVAPHG